MTSTVALVEWRQFHLGRISNIRYMIASSDKPQPSGASAWDRVLTQIRTLFGFTISSKSLEFFFESMYVCLRSGRSIADTIQREASGMDAELRSICASIAPKLRNGASLCDCLRPYARRFPPIVLCILEVGEVSGTLEDQAHRLANTFKQTNGFERKFRFSVYDPRLLLLALCLIQSIHLMIMEVTSTETGRSMGTMALSVVYGVLITAVGLSSVYFIGRIILSQIYRWQAFRFFVDTIKLALPRIGVISRNLSAARWARSFAVLWAAGINISTALEVSAGSALNARYERALLNAAKQTRQGVPLSECLAGLELLPRYLLDVIKLSEMSGKMDESLLTLATEMERDALCRAVIQMNQFVIYAQVVVIIAAVIIAVLATGIIHFE